MNSVFVQIASYRDKELYPTISDLINKSSGENRLTFGIVWQKDDSESIGDYANNKNFRIIDVPWHKSKGLGWARSLTQSLYDNEDYTLQLDSHHRFAKNWDVTLIEMLEKLKPQSPKPLLTAYAAGYDPNNTSSLNDMPCRILPHDFKKSGTIWFNPTPIPNYHTLCGPIRARFVSGHYFFTGGSHCFEYKYDPDMYFAGDEICLSVRSYTLGYDLYHPHVNVVWHYYGRNDQIKHWGDHNQNNKDGGLIDKTWGERDLFSKKRIAQLLGEEDYGIDLGEFGVGNVRSLYDYEIYSGIDFRKKRIQLGAISGLEPPIVFDNESDRIKGFNKVVPVNIVNWNKHQFMEIIDKIKICKLEILNLSQNVIFEHEYPVEFIKYNTILSHSISSDHMPMKYILTAYDANNQVLHRIGADMRLGIHWN